MRHKATMIAAGFAGGVFLFASVVSFIVFDVGKAEITALSENTMVSLVGGIDKTQGWLHEGCDDYMPACRFADCSATSGSSCSRVVYKYEPDWYGCYACTSGQTKYYDFTMYREYWSWCKWNASKSKCEYKTRTVNQVLDCEFSQESTCS